MVVTLDVDPDLHEVRDHVVAEVLELVGRGHREVPLLEARLVAEVRALVAAGVPLTFDRVDRVEARVLVGLEADVIEDEELRLGPEVRGVAEPTRDEVLGDAECVLGSGIGDAGNAVERTGDQVTATCADPRPGRSG